MDHSPQSVQFRQPGECVTLNSANLMMSQISVKRIQLPVHCAYTTNLDDIPAMALASIPWDRLCSKRLLELNSSPLNETPLRNTYSSTGDKF